MSMEENRWEAIENAKRFCGATKGQITQCTNQLKAKLIEAEGEVVRPLIQDLETQNLFQKLQGLSSSFEATYEKYISLWDVKETEAEDAEI